MIALIPLSAYTLPMETTPTYDRIIQGSSSVVEHCSDKAVVVGAIPTYPTIFQPNPCPNQHQHFSW